MTAARSDLKPGQILGIEPSIDRDLAERQLPQTFQDELKALRLAASQPDREALKEFIVSASFASRAALDSDTIFCEIYTPGYSPAKKGSFGFFVKELRAILSLLSGAGTKSDGGGQTIKRHHYSPSTLHMGDCSICGNVYDAPLHIGSPADHAASHSAGRKPGPSDAKLAIAVSALEFVRDGYGDQDVNHVDYRVRVYEVALDALAQLTKTPSADHDAGNLRGLSAPNHQLHAVSQGWRDDMENAPHNTPVLLAWEDWRDGQWCMEIGPAITGQRYANGHSSISHHGSATHWQPRPAPPSPAKTGGAE